MSDENTTAGQESQQTSATQTAQSSDTSTATQSTGADTTSTTTDSNGTVESRGAETSTTDTSGDDKGELQRFREQLAGGDAGLLKQLERHKSVESISKSFKEARNAAKSAGKPLTLGEKATPEEVKAYREAMGIPEEAKDYPLAFRQDFKGTDRDKNILESAKAYAHEKNGDPRTAAIMLDWYQDFATEQRQALDGNLAKVAKDTQATLRNEWGGEYDGNLNAAAELMTSQLGEDGFKDMMGLRLMDGSRLQDNIAFVKMMAQLGSDYYGGTNIVSGDVETTAKTVQDQIDELLKLRETDEKKYFSDDVQGKITKLYEQRAKINARKK